MAVLKNVLGLDVGSHSIKAVEFRQTLRGLEAVQLRMLPRAEDDLPLAEQLLGFAELHRLTSGHVVAALPGDRAPSRRLEFPFRERKRLAQTIPFELASSVPYELDDFLVDWDVASDEKGHSDVLATIAPRGDVSQLISTLREAGLEPRTLEAEGPVLANLCGVFDLPGTRLLADLGHRKTTLCLVVDGRPVAARTVPVAGRAISMAIAQERGLAPGQAERVKCEEGVFGGSFGPQSAVHPVLERLAREIVRTLASLEGVVSKGGGGPVSEITIFGGTAQIERLDEFLSERTGLTTQRLGLPLEGACDGLAAGGSPILFGPAIALGLRGTTRARTRLDFRQEEFAVRVDLSGIGRSFRGTGVFAAVAAVLAIVSFGTGLVLDSRRARGLERQLEAIYAEARPGEPLRGSPVAAMREALRVAEERADFLGVYHGNLSALDLLAEISRVIPEDVKISVEELTIDRQTIRMRCNTESFEATDRLNAALAKIPAFSQARIGSIETDRKSGAKRFNVTISLANGEEDRA